MTSFIRWWLIFSSGSKVEKSSILQEERHHREELAAAAATSEAAVVASSEASTASKSDSNSDKKSLQNLDDVVIVHQNSEVAIKSDFSLQVKRKIFLNFRAKKCIFVNLLKFSECYFSGRKSDEENPKIIYCGARRKRNRIGHIKSNSTTCIANKRLQHWILRMRILHNIDAVKWNNWCMMKIR